MRILVIALLKPSQIKYKIIPLLRSKYVDEIIIVRKYPGPELEKVRYLILPKICRIKIFNLILTPIILTYYSFKIKPDILLSYHFIPHGVFAWMVSLFTGIPFIYSQIDIDVQKLARIPLLGILIYYIIDKAVLINVPGSKSKLFWTNRGIDPGKINILHSSINTEEDFFPQSIKKEFDLIYVGVLEKRKQVDLIIKAIARLKEKKIALTLLVVGAGKSMIDLQKLSQNLNLTDKITFIGHSNKISEMLNKASYFALTSKNEGIPCGMMEAMACGLVPISTDVADVSDIVKNGETGFLIRAYTTISVSETLEKMLSEKQNYSRYSANARRIIVEEHSYSRTTLLWDNIFKDYLK